MRTHLLLVSGLLGLAACAHSRPETGVPSGAVGNLASSHAVALGDTTGLGELLGALHAGIEGAVMLQPEHAVTGELAAFLHAFDAEPEDDRYIELRTEAGALERALHQLQRFTAKRTPR